MARLLRPGARRTLGPLAVAAALTLAAVALAGGDATTRIAFDGASPAAKRYAEAVAEVAEGSNAVVLAPEQLRFAHQPSLKRRMHAAATPRDRRWEISLEIGRECGADACFVGLLAAAPGELPDHGWRRVRLAEGTRGAFRGVSCGGSCAPANILWREHRLLHTLQIAVPPGDPGSRRERRAMVAMANSAINAGAR